jgi:DNA-binding CsgD family transcriptional regulator
MPASVVGRDAELAALTDFLAGIPDGASVLLLEGEAGMGKTTLWRAGVHDAETGELCVLWAEPAETEIGLSFSGLGDLLDPVLEEALAPLAAGQRSVLARALVLEDVEGPAPDAHAAGVALLNVLRGLAAARNVLVAVDDVQWLDAASAGALAYAVRRLRDERVGVLLARRAGLESPVVDDLGRSVRDRFVRLDVGPLDPGALHQVVHAHLGASLPRPLLAEVHQASGGNPFYALEIVRTLTRSDTSVEAGRPLPVPDSLQDLVHGRLLALSLESREFLTAAAAYAHPTIAITESASGVARDVGLTPAREARIVELHGEEVRFTHPLLAAGALETADPLRRAGIHSRLAELLEDPEARAWQLAACTSEPDNAVAQVLEDAAGNARARGAPRPAALLLDRARELTPADRAGEATRRGVDAAYLHFESGDSHRAETQLRELIAPLTASPERARALWVLARIRTYEAPAEAVTLFREVLNEADRDQEMLSVAHEGLASSLLWTMESLAEAVHHAETAFAFAVETDDETLAGDALVSQLLAEGWLGLERARTTAERALALQDATTDRRVMDQPLVALVQYWSWIDELERARDALSEMLLSARDLGDESSRPYLLSLLAQVSCALADLEQAGQLAREGKDTADQSGQPLLAAYNLAVAALACAQQGRADHARENVARALEIVPTGNGEVGVIAAAALGHLALALGRPSDVVAHLEPTVTFVRTEAIVEPGAIRFVVDQVEALVELGRRDEAVELLEWYEANARRLERSSALASCARCRGLLAARGGDLDAALAAFEEALEWHAQVELPLDRGRTLLALGVTQRRLKRRREARATLEQALELFEEIGAELWAERTRAELKRISGRAATPGALTPAEERVAALVAEGKTNKEVAAALFLSDRTVEGHLARIFGKLGVRQRAEVAGALQTRGIDLSNTGDSPVSAESSAP